MTPGPAWPGAAALIVRVTDSEARAAATVTEPVTRSDSLLGSDSRAVTVSESLAPRPGLRRAESLAAWAAPASDPGRTDHSIVTTVTELTKSQCFKLQVCELSHGHGSHDTMICRTGQTGPGLVTQTRSRMTVGPVSL